MTQQNTRHILISETTFNRLSGRLASFDDTIDGVITRALDKTETTGGTAPSAPKTYRAYSHDENGLRIVPEKPNRKHISFTSLKRVSIIHDGEDTPVLRRLKTALETAHLTWNSTVAAVASVYFHDHFKGISADALHDIAPIRCLGMQINYYPKSNPDVPKGWYKIETGHDTTLAYDPFLQGMSAFQALAAIRQMIRNLSLKNRNEIKFTLQIELIWDDNKDAAFPGEGGRICIPSTFH